MNILELIKPYVPEIILLFSGAGFWGHERMKRRQDANKRELDNNKSIIDLYQEALNDLKIRYDIKFAELEEEIEKLRKNLNQEKSKYNSLKKSFDELKSSK